MNMNFHSQLCRSYERLRAAGLIISIESIIERVCTAMNVTPEQIAGKSRKMHIVMARHMAVKIARVTTCHSYSAIARELGDRDHSTMVHSIHAADDLLDTSQRFCDIYLSLMEDIESNSVTVFRDFAEEPAAASIPKPKLERHIPAMKKESDVVKESPKVMPPVDRSINGVYSYKSIHA